MPREASTRIETTRFGRRCGVPDLTHIDASGQVRMVDVGEKPLTRRTAVAEGLIRMRAETLDAVETGRVEKGEALAVARIAAIQGTKRTPSLIPLCHPVPIDAVDVDIVPVSDPPGYRVTVRVSAEWRTGVEMEALTGVGMALLALYDMCKAMERGMEIGPVRLLEKRGGRSGTWQAADASRVTESEASRTAPESAGETPGGPGA